LILAAGLFSGGLLYSGVIARNRRVKNRVRRLKTPIPDFSASESRPPVQTTRRGDENYPIATATLGFTVAGRVLYAPFTLVGIVGILYLFWPVVTRAYHDLARRRRFTSIVLESVILPGTILAGNFLAVATAYWFIYFALNNVAKAKWHASERLAEAFSAPSNQLFRIQRGPVATEAAVKDLIVGDVVLIGGGEIIPIDGVITGGDALVDEHLLTGEAKPIEKRPGDTVLANTLLLNGCIQVRVAKAGQETIADQSAKILNGMTRFTETLELRGTDASDRTALPLFVLASATGLFWGASRGLAIAWAPLDDALFAAGPLSVLNFLTIALRQDILVKDGRALEVLRHVDTFVFDKTGTLTTDVPQIVDVHSCASLSRNDVLRYAAAAEQKQSHPIALAIVAAAQEEGIEIPSIRRSAYQAGLGITGEMDATTISVGSFRFMQQMGLPIPQVLHRLDQHSREFGYSVIYVALDENVVGAIEVHAGVRKEAAKTMAALHDLGFRVCIISGDNAKPTQHLANELGVEQYFAEKLPQDKGQLIATMQEAGHVVCYVGDGINDTIALKQAEVSVSLRGASTLAVDTAQIVLMKKDLSQLLGLIALAKRLDKNFKAALLCSAIPTAAIFAGVLLFNISLAAAIALYLAGMGLSISEAMFPLLTERKETVLPETE
jgi:Cu2+-exporting ATPase